MGSYLGRPCRSFPPQALGGQHLPGGLDRSQPDPRTRRFSVAGPGHPAVAPLSTCRPAHKYPVTLHLRFVTASLRRCSMIPQTLRSFLGVLTSLCRRRHQRKAVLGARISTMCRGSASAEGTVTVCGGHQQQVTPVPPTTLRCAPGSCTEKMVRRALGESGKGMAQQEEDPESTGKDHQERGPDGSRGARSTFRPLGAQRDLSAFVPKPGPLRRNLHAKSSVDRSTKKLQTSCVSSCPQGNAITSSYSSTRGFPPGRRRTGPGIPRGLPRRSSRKASEAGLPPPCAAPVASQSNSRSDEDAEATRGQKRTWKIGAPTSDSPRPGRRRFPLLRRRRGEPLRLPPPPELGFRVTAEDMDAEKAAASGASTARCGMRPRPGSPAVPSPRPPTLRPPAGLLGPRETRGSRPPQRQWTPGRLLEGPPLRIPGQEGGTAPPGPFPPGPSPSRALLPTHGPPPRSPCPPALPPQDRAARACLLGPQAPLPLLQPPRQVRRVRRKAWLRPRLRLGFPASSRSPSGGLLRTRQEEEALPSPRRGARLRRTPDRPSLQRPAPRAWGPPHLCAWTLLSSPTRAVLLPSPCISGDLAPHPASDTEVTPMDTIPPSQSPLFGSPPGSSGSLFPSSQALQTPPRDSAASVTVSTSLPGLFSGSSHTRAPAQPIAGAPDAPPAPPTNSPIVTHASTQPALAATPAAFPSGPAPAPGSAADTCVPQAMPSAGPNSRPCCSTYFNGKKGSPENHTQQSGKSGPPHWGLPGQSPTMVTMGPRAKNKPSAKNKPGFGGATAPIFNHMPGDAPRQSPHTSSPEDSPPPLKVAFRGVSAPASTPQQPGNAML
ncbi:PREDICTED: nuclear envelope pore membrane protein POM 121C-like [Bison bison bison]|uniref:Nuclear envelope pore membrane protein POM 121C-like n=1 Tax=Bison bison bison TaxID=43346 RepID=A0A6P3G5V5_BISBB|nr:PREDICTED: nuclear envelope pore membrane protein POM 121C-like [Bison bison bison]